MMVQYHDGHTKNAFSKHYLCIKMVESVKVAGVTSFETLAAYRSRNIFNYPSTKAIHLRPGDDSLVIVLVFQVSFISASRGGDPVGPPALALVFQKLHTWCVDTGQTFAKHTYRSATRSLRNTCATHLGHEH